MVGVAVKVTEVPTQILIPGFAAISTEGTAVAFTITSTVKGTPVQFPDFGVTTY